MHVCSRNCVVVLHVYCSIYRKMIAAAWVWAANTKNLRRNAIHGEAKLVLNEKFEAADITAQEIQMRGEIDVEDPIAPNVHACVCVCLHMHVIYNIYIYIYLSLYMYV